MMTNSKWMTRALSLAARGINTTSPNPRVGCVLINDNVVIGEGWHQRAGEGHAEVNAIRDAQQRGNNTAGATAYVTLEPCSHTGRTAPCAEALINAQVSTVVVAMQDPNPLVSGRGNQRLRDAGLEVIENILQDEARALNPGFIQRMETGFPLLRLKLASSLDGKTAMASGESKWITSAAARADVQQWRARACAILTGINTVLADDPQLNVRLDDTQRQPARIVLDSHLRCPPTAQMLQGTDSGTGPVIILHCDDSASGKQRAAELEAAGASTVYIVTNDQQQVDLLAVQQWLGEQGFNEVHVECGATLAGSLITSEIIDEVLLYIAPCLMGDDGRGLAVTPHLKTMDQRIQLTIHEMRAVGSDWRVLARPVRT